MCPYDDGTIWYRGRNDHTFRIRVCFQQVSSVTQFFAADTDLPIGTKKLKKAEDIRIVLTDFFGFSDPDDKGIFSENYAFRAEYKSFWTMSNEIS